MALPTYLTIDEADTILGATLPWNASSDSLKLDALEMARAYCDANYRKNFIEDDGIPESVKYGNALIANENLISSIFTRQDGLGSLEEKTVKADDVTVTKKYTNKVSQVWKDPFQKATAIMRPYFILVSGSAIRTVQLIRG